MTNIEKFYLKEKRENQIKIIERFSDMLITFNFINAVNYIKKLTNDDFREKISEMFTKKITLYNANNYINEIKTTCPNKIIV